MKCQYCDNQVPNNAAKCPSCGAAVQQVTNTPVGQSSAEQSVLSSDEAFKAKIAYVSPYYQAEFTKMYDSKGAYKGKFNLAAFFFSWIWCFTKGLAVQGIIMFVLACISYGLISGILAGIRGNKMFYEKFINEKNVYL